MDRAQLADWLWKYKRCYELDDADLVVTLFTEDATYQVTPFAIPRQAEQFHTMWAGGKSRRYGNHIALQVWHLEGDTAIVEWIAYAIYYEKGLHHGNGMFILTFAKDGRCSSLREWQHWHPKGMWPAPPPPRRAA